MKNSTKNQKRAVVIGGGIHGITAAIMLAQNNVEVTLIEKRDDILQGTSCSTHNRAHMGYHYPRSIETAKECYKGLSFFKKKYPQALFYPKDVYYLIEKNDSHTSAKAFKKFCKEVKLPYTLTKKSNGFWSEDMVECGFKVKEPIFDVSILSKLFKKEAKELNIKILTETEIIDMKDTGNVYNIVLRKDSKIKNIKADIILNATYAYSNNIMKILDLEEDMTEYELQKTEVVLVRSEVPLPALTVMDGNFVSIMPLANQEENLFLIYDVSHSVLEKKRGFFLDDTKKYKTNFKKMIKNGKKYYPFMESLKFVQSNFGYRPIPHLANTSRKTRIISHKKKPGIYSICEGKFISSPLVAKQLITLMKKDKTIV